MNPREFESDRNPSELPEALRQNLVGYKVINPQDLVVGRVEEVVLDRNRRLYLALSRGEVGADSAWVWLPGESIQTVEPTQRALYINLSPAELDRLPPYQKSEVSEAPATVSRPASEDSRVVEEHQISLLEEKLVVKRDKQKVGEIIVRKEIETHMVQVPVRSEKLIIEQVGPQPKRLAEINIGREEIVGIESRSAEQTDGRYTVLGEFGSLQAAAEALNAIAQHPLGNAFVRIELTVDSLEAQQQYNNQFKGRSPSV